MEKGLFEVLTEICNEKGISQEVLIDALEAALVAAYKKNFYSAQNVEVSIDRESGTVKVFAKKEVVDLVYDEFEEISLEDARAINGNYQIGDMVNIEVTPKDFGRISAMTAKQVVTQRIREAERGNPFSEAKDYACQEEKRPRPHHGTLRQVKREILVAYGFRESSPDTAFPV